jgi:hypothetical protein
MKQVIQLLKLYKLIGNLKNFRGRLSCELRGILQKIDSLNL